MGSTHLQKNKQKKPVDGHPSIRLGCHREHHGPSVRQTDDRSHLSLIYNHQLT